MPHDVWGIVASYLDVSDLLPSFSLISRIVAMRRDDFVWGTLFRRLFPSLQPCLGSNRASLTALLRLMVATKQHHPVFHRFLRRHFPEAVIRLGRVTFQVLDAEPVRAIQVHLAPDVTAIDGGKALQVEVFGATGGPTSRIESISVRTLIGTAQVTLISYKGCRGCTSLHAFRSGMWPIRDIERVVKRAANAKASPDIAIPDTW